MLVRSLFDSELEALIALHPMPEFLRERLTGFIEKGETSVDLCFAAFDAGNVRCGATYLQLDPDRPDLALFDLIPPDCRGMKDEAVEVLVESARSLSSRGFGSVEFALEIRPDHPEDGQIPIFLEAGYKIAQAKFRYEWTGGSVRKTVKAGLTFLPSTELTDEEWVKLVRAGSVGTLDQLDRQEINTLGADKAAEQLISVLKSLDHQPELWTAARNEIGELVGLVIPQMFTPELGALNYVAVTPENRGKGYSLELLSFATETLVQRGIKRIIADIDRQNFPLVAALGSVGFTRRADLNILRKSLG